MSTVYIVNKGGHNFNAAKRFGELVYMSEDEMSKFATSQMVRKFRPFVESSGPEDYLLLSGLTVMCSVASGMFAKKHGRLNLLIYKVNDYEERQIEF